jgi:hypothetical protein
MLSQYDTSAKGLGQGSTDRYNIADGFWVIVQNNSRYIEQIETDDPVGIPAGQHVCGTRGLQQSSQSSYDQLQITL